MSRKMEKKSEQWPNSKSGTQSRDTKVVPPFFLPRQLSCPLEQVVADANEEVLKLEAAVRALGGESSFHAKPEARQSEVTSSPSDQEVGSVPELPRTRKRVVRAEELIAKATEPKSAFVLEVQEAEERLQREWRSWWESGQCSDAVWSGDGPHPMPSRPCKFQFSRVARMVQQQLSRLELWWVKAWLL